MTAPCRAMVPAALLLAAALGGTQAEAGRRMVDVGGHRLRLHCTGRGEPTVVLEAGAGDSHRVWSEVQPAIARFTRVCSYDRAGLGNSEPGPLPRTSGRIVEELVSLMRVVHLDLPAVFVGHSFGGLNVRLLARKYPENVAGLVLVDATHERYVEHASTLLTRREKSRRETLAGVLPASARSELASLDVSGLQLCGAPASAAVPTIVITAGKRNERPALFDLWQQLQRDIFVSTEARAQVIADRSGHNVQFDQPELVVGAVRDLVEAFREQPAHRP